MPKGNTSRQIAAHFTQEYLDSGKDTDVLQDFSKVLEGRVRSLRRSGDREKFQDVGSLLYCVRDLKDSCRDAGENMMGKNPEAAGKNLNRAARRVHEIGQLLVDIRKNYPDEYETSCDAFMTKWKNLEFNKGQKLLDAVDSAALARQKQQMPEPPEVSMRPVSQPEHAAPSMTIRM